MMTFGSLFSGIGGFDLGLERAGMKCVWQVEIDPYCLRVLNKHWPNVRKWEDVKMFPPKPKNEWTCDLICGGFPCQPVSIAGKRKGKEDERWLWPDFLRVIRLLRPRFVLVENVPGLLRLGMGEVLGGLAASGYDSEWESLPAAAFGAPHLRERIFIVSYSPLVFSDGGDHYAGCDREGSLSSPEFGNGGGEGVPGCGRWNAEPDVGRVADGVPSRMDRLRGLGNAVVPQVIEWIGKKIIEFEKGATK